MTLIHSLRWQRLGPRSDGCCLLRPSATLSVSACRGDELDQPIGAVPPTPVYRQPITTHGPSGGCMNWVTPGHTTPSNIKLDGSSSSSEQNEAPSSYPLARQSPRALVTRRGLSER